MAESSKKTDVTDVADIETLSDEEFLKLEEPEAIEEINTEEINKDKEKPNDTDDDADIDAAAADAAAKAAGSGDTPEGTGSGDSEDEPTGDGTVDTGDGEGGEGDGGADEVEVSDKEKAEAEKKAAEEAEAEKAKGVNKDKETLTLKDKDGKETEPTKEETKAALVIEEQAEATSFFEKVSAPFKADGKEVQIRTAEEAIRLMQMGVNYSMRMRQMKPLRAMDAMLTEHGLNDPAKLNELIDLSKGGKEAIQKYLAKHNIDPLDLDTSKADDHTTPNYQSDPKDIAFQEAIDNTLQAEGGKELLNDVNRDWDSESKESLRDNPSIFGKLLEHKDTGVYDQIQKELLHQRTMGYLTGVPFLQAYEEVGNAMVKAGVFDTKTTQKTGLAPIDSGSRKAAPKPKTEQPNPNLSSSSKSRKTTSKDVAPIEPDYLSMSDADFMKLAQPT